jgi:hypothetical protein
VFTCTVVVLTCLVIFGLCMCGFCNVWMCMCGFCNVWVCMCGFCNVSMCWFCNVCVSKCGCFGNMFTCIYCVFVLFHLCIFILFMRLFNL